VESMQGAPRQERGALLCRVSAPALAGEQKF
jgi:hypothetical protein